MKKAIETSQRAAEEFGGGLYALTSFGNESALLPDILQKAGVEVGFITIDTGFWFPETHEFKDRLTARYRFDLDVYGPSEEDIADILEERLWETDINAYHEITKQEPLRRAIGELGVTALLSGVRADQTANRSSLNALEPGKDGELRIHPLLHWPEAEAARYFQRWRWPNLRGLPRHPLYYRVMVP